MPNRNAASTCMNRDFHSADRPAGAGTEAGDIATVDMLGLRSAVRKFAMTQNQAMTVPTSEHQLGRAVIRSRGDQRRLPLLKQRHFHRPNGEIWPISAYLMRRAVIPGQSIWLAALPEDPE